MFTTPGNVLSIGPVLLVCAGLLVGCASTQPELSPSGKAITTVSIPDAQMNDSLELIESDGQLPEDDVQGISAVRWGGTIARVENLAQERTLIEVVSRPLRGNGRPVHNDQSEGRFLIYIDKFLDPEIVQPGRDVTVTGSLVARQGGVIGETQYVFPVVAAQSVNYWRVQTESPQRHYPHWSPFSRRRSDLFWDPWIHHRRPGYR